MTFFEDYQIDGRPLLAPDRDVVMTRTDLDAEDSGRDESGFFHRIPVRCGMGQWELCYSSLTAAEYAYLEDLFGGKTQFAFTYRDHTGKLETCQAYRSEHSIALHDGSKGLYRGCKLSITEC